ncbi:MAG: hypothetical protein QM731_11440 [Chitinophagaceae bacterium]
MPRSKAITGTIEFREEQRFRQLWLWTLLGFSVAGSTILLVVLGIDEFKQGKPAILNALALVIGVHVINLAAFYYTRFEIRVTSTGIFYRWRPFFRSYSFVAWPEIQDAYVRKFSAMKYGYHKSRNYGSVHNVDGGKGIQLVLQNGRKVFIGSQRIAAIESAIGKFREVSVEPKQIALKL